MAHKKRGRNILTQDEDSDSGSRLHRREFLAMGSIAAASMTGYVTGTAKAATTGTGYGTESYGAYGYGALEPTG